jgi:hypothetical protein
MSVGAPHSAAAHATRAAIDGRPALSMLSYSAVYQPRNKGNHLMLSRLHDTHINATLRNLSSIVLYRTATRINGGTPCV